MYIRANFKPYACLLPMSLLVAGSSVPAWSQSWPPKPFSEATIYSFTGGGDGGSPLYGPLLADSSGALYGTTSSGGSSNAGAVFKLTPPAYGKAQWTETVLYSFSGPDGATPLSGLVRDTSGALYGVTSAGGANDAGVAFKLSQPVPPSAQWSYAKIYDFTPSTGSSPSGGLMFDGAGSLIGAASGGGAYGFGSIYKLTPPTSAGCQWTAATLYNFFGGADGANPMSTLVSDTSGALYGTAPLAGASPPEGPYSLGVVFMLTPPGADCTPKPQNLWCLTALHRFGGYDDGGQPYAGLTMDSLGTFYGTTRIGGTGNSGVAYSLTPPTPPSTQWRFAMLHNFGGGQGGGYPMSSLILVGGAFYGSTYGGGGTGCGGIGCGTLFQLVPPAGPTGTWTENTFYRFTAGADGAFPFGGLTVAALHFGLGSAVYGMTNSGGVWGYGTIFTLQCAQPVREVFGGALHAGCAQ